MKIEGQYPKVPVQDKGSPKGKEKGDVQIEKNKPADIKKTSADQFAVKKMRSKMETEPDMDLEKVKALKEKIKKGEYQVDQKKLAANLLKDSLLEDI